MAAAGNNGTDDDTAFFAPASYSMTYPNVIAVAATDSNGDLASWSDYGTGSVKLAAPGVNIVSTLGSGYSNLSGTSMAAPFVTGTIALVEAAHPTWSMSQVEDAVLDHTTPDPALTGKVTTGGIVNAAAAVANTDGAYVVSAVPNGAGSVASPLSSIGLTFNEEINPATFTPAQVSLTGPGGTINGVTVTAVSGSNDHQFKVSFPAQTAGGPYTLTVGPNIQDWYGNVMDQNRNGVNGEATDAFTMTVAQTTPDHLGLSSTSSTVTAGGSMSFTVKALGTGGAVDTNYLGTLEFSSTDPQAALPADYTFTTTDAGVHTFTVKLKTAGDQSITATDTVTASITGTESKITVQPAAAALLSVSGFPSPYTAGTPETITVTALDAYGNVATGYTGTAGFTSGDPQAALPASYTFTAADAGTHTFTATLKTAGSQKLNVTDANSKAVTAAAETIKVAAAAATSLAITGFPATVTAGTQQSLKVTIYDPYGNVATGYTGTVHLTSSDPQATFSASYSFTSADAGIHIFHPTLKTAGVQWISVKDGANGFSATVSNITVNPAALAALAVTGFPSTAAAGSINNFTVTARRLR